LGSAPLSKQYNTFVQQILGGMPVLLFDFLFYFLLDSLLSGYMAVGFGRAAGEGSIWHRQVMASHP
jgi:hypothetical protein